MGFSNSVIGGAAALIRAAIKSPNYVAGSAGWQIAKDGSAEFNNVAIRGTISGTLYVLNSQGLFGYSPSEAAGNLVSSALVSTAGTDQFGNHYLTGTTSYDAGGTATQLDSGAMSFYTGSLAAGWTSAAQIFLSGAVIELITSGGVITSNNTLDNGSGAATFNGNVTVAGQNLNVGNGSNALINMNPPMATPPNTAAVKATTATLAQAEACLGALIQSMQNRGMIT